MTNNTNQEQIEQEAESKGTLLSSSDFFEKLALIPNYQAENIRLALSNGEVTIGKIIKTTEDIIPPEPSPSQQEVAVSFAEWIKNNYWERIDKYLWHNMVDNCIEGLTTAQLFQLFSDRNKEEGK